MNDLLPFLFEHSKGADVICLQEVSSSLSGVRYGEGFYANSFEQIRASIGGTHDGFFFGAQDHFRLDDEPVDFPIDNGLAIFVRRGLPLAGHGDEFVYGWRNSKGMAGAPPTVPRNLAWVRVRMEDHILSIFNLHGLWTREGKGDTADRIEQSRLVNAITSHIQSMTPLGQQVLCGDLNLNPGTISVTTLAAARRDLIAEYGITSTRTPLYRKWQEGAPMYADYMFVSQDPSLQVDDFMVLPDEVSDHAALRVWITIG